MLPAAALVVAGFATSAVGAPVGQRNPQRPVGYNAADRAWWQKACPPYQNYAAVRHPPYSKGPLAMPFQRPAVECRTFTSPAVEQVIADVTSRMTDPDLARLFENAFPNTLDTTISWHDPYSTKPRMPQHVGMAHVGDHFKGAGPHSFIVTGDITAEWLRDSTNQLQSYHALAPKDPALKTLILGAINTQAEYVIESPYCNAFQPPPASDLRHGPYVMEDIVHPMVDPEFVMECKYELDSLAAFLKLGNEYQAATGATDFFTDRWFEALDAVMYVIEQQQNTTFEEDGGYSRNEYTFQRRTLLGTETLNLAGLGNPIGRGTGLVRSAFRPSDDATILPFFIPANAMMSVELLRTAKILQAKHPEQAARLKAKGDEIAAGVKKYGIVRHPVYGEVYAYEVDGYGSNIFMDDANVPSLLAMPLMGFCDKDDTVYQNTRKMILSRSGNPYYLVGREFSGIGGPHVGLQNAWPMSRMVQALTSDDDDEIRMALAAVKKTAKLGLVHESVHVERAASYTRPWFAWANSVLGHTILDLAERKPHILFGEGKPAYKVGNVREEEIRKRKDAMEAGEPPEEEDEEEKENESEVTIEQESAGYQDRREAEYDEESEREV